MDELVFIYFLQVLSIVDTNHHIPKDMKETGFPSFKGKKKLDQDFTERITLHVPFIGISLMNSSPQVLIELLHFLREKGAVDTYHF